MEVRVFGPVELFDGESAVRLSAMERTLLAALAARAGERVSADALEEALWPAQRPATARKTLQGYVARLRRALGPTRIIYHSSGYRLDPDHVLVDARRIATLVSEARDSTRRGDAAGALSLLADASTAFRGEPYEDVAESAVPAGEVQRLLELQATVFEETIEAELGCHRGAQRIGDLEAFLERNPFRERAWGQLMLALYRAGRAADALAAYGRARQLFASELGLEPGPALRNLERSILTHDRSLGTEAASDGLGAGNLPVALTPIVGRDAELIALGGLIRRNRLVTLTGTGGIGKTRLAIELLARSSGTTDDQGPYFVDLASLRIVELVPSALAQSLGVRVDSHDDVEERVHSALGGHRVTVLVDNCEHLLPALSLVIASLLTSCRGLRVVATSREPLDVAGELVWPVGPLGVPPAGASPDEVQRSDSGSLFLARLPANVAASCLNPVDLAAVGALCLSLDGIPLGLELAAARSRTFSLPVLARRLQKSIDELSLPGHGRVPRHRAMRAALEWGVQLLSAPAQVALRAMSVFAGGCDLDAFTEVCVDDGSQSIEVLDELVRTSFVIADLADPPPRYRLLEPVRQYARDLLEASGDSSNRHRRHLQFYVDLAEALRDDFYRPGGHMPLQQLHKELGNVRAALDWAAEAPEYADAGLTLAASLHYFWTRESHHAEGLARLIELLRTDSGSPEARSRAARYAAVIAGELGRSEQKLILCEQAVNEAIRSSDKTYEVRARQILAHAEMERGELSQARKHLDPAFHLKIDPADNALIFCEVTRAHINLVSGDLEKAEAGARRVITGNFSSVPYLGTEARMILGQVMLERGHTALARSWLTEALSLAETSGDWAAGLAAHLHLVSIECASGRVDEANAQFRAACELGPERAPLWDGWFLKARAELALYEGNPIQATSLTESAVAMFTECTPDLGHSECLRLLGDTQLANDGPDRALATYELLIKVAEPVPYPCRLAEGHEGAAAAANALGHRLTASRHFGAATQIRRRTVTRRLRRPAVEEHLVGLRTEQDLDRHGPIDRPPFP